MHSEPARIIAIIVAVVTAAFTTWQAQVSMLTAGQVSLVVAAIAAVGALATGLLTVPFGLKLIPLVVAAIQAVAAVVTGFGFDTGDTPIGVLAVVLAAIGGEVNRSTRSPNPVPAGG